MKAPSLLLTDRWESEVEKVRCGQLTDWNPQCETVDTRPNKIMLIPIGEYNGVDLPGVIVDENYIVWQEINDPAYNCEVKIYD